MARAAQYDFSGKHAIVTGGAAGIGRAIVENGAKVTIFDRDTSALEAAKAELGENVNTAEVDVSDEASVKAAVKVAQAFVPHIDILVNSAGITGPNTTVIEYPVQEWNRVFDINIRQDYATVEIVRQSLKLANMFKLNDEELPIVASMLGITGSDESVITKLISNYDLICVILTRGSAGSTIYTKDEVSFCESQDVAIVDTVGAGDSFTAAVVMGFLEGKPLNLLHRRASQIADYVCTQQGATPLLNDNLIGY